MSAKSSVLGISKPFEVKHLPSNLSSLDEEKEIPLEPASRMKEKEL